MAHEIFGDRFLGRSEPAWHGLGTVFGQDERIGVLEAVQKAGCDYELVKSPILVEAFGQQVATDQMAIVRQALADDPEPRVLGIVGKDYEIVSNNDIARALEPLRDAWPVETVGALRQGDGFFVTLKVGRLALPTHDEIDRFFLVNGNHANGQSVNIGITTTKVVCANTLALALSERGPDAMQVSLPHVRGAGADVQVAVSLMARLHRADAEAVRILEALALTRVTEAQVAAIIEAAYPFKAAPSKARFAAAAREQGLDASRFEQAEREIEQYNAHLTNYREMALKAYALVCDREPALAGTAWGGLNAVTEVENHRVGSAGVASSIMFGERAKFMSQGLRAAVQLAGGQDVARAAGSPAPAIVSLPRGRNRRAPVPTVSLG